MKKLLLALFCLTWGTTVGAQHLDYLTFRLADGSEKSLPIDGLKITFEGTQLHAVAQNQKADFNLAEMGMMFFSAVPTAIASVVDDENTVAIVNGRLQVNAPEGANVEVYSTDGRLVRKEGLSRGVYLVKVDGRTFKIWAK